MSNPQGTWEGEAKRLQNKSDDHAIKTMSNKMRREGSNQGHQALWATQMTYSLPGTSMSLEELENIQRKARRASLGKLGFNQNFPKAVVYGPSATGGLKMVDLAIEQGIRATENFFLF